MLLNELKNNRINAMKNHEDDVYKTLTLVMGELSRLDNKEPDDAEVIKVITKMIKSSTETYNLKPSDELLNELNVLKSYLPKQLTETELSDVIDNLLSVEKTLPFVMKNLKTNYGGLYDGKLASELIKNKLI